MWLFGHQNKINKLIMSKCGFGVSLIIAEREIGECQVLCTRNRCGASHASARN